MMETDSLTTLLNFDFNQRYEISKNGEFAAFRGKFIKPSNHEFRLIDKNSAT
jgi:hypothetical protein